MKNIQSFSKNIILSILCLIIFNKNLSNAQSKQEESLMKVIRTENEAFFNRDTAKLKSVWLRNDAIQRSFISKWSLFEMKGWEKIQIEIDKLAARPIDRVPLVIKYENVKTHIFNKMAFVEYDKVIPKIDDLNFDSHDYGILINEKNQWKLLKLVTLYTETFSNNPRNLEENLNDTGYQFLGSNKTSEAIELFKMNVRLNPKSWNVYDSLGEAFALAGDKKLAIENYEKSLELKPNSKSAKMALEKLRK